MTDALHTKLDRWRIVAEFDSRAGAPVGNALYDACNEIERLRRELDAKLKSKALGRALIEMREFAQRETERADEAEAEVKRLREVLARREGSAR